MKTLFFVLLFSFAFSPITQGMKTDRANADLSLTVNCDDLAINAYHSAREHGSSHGDAQGISEDVWHDCMNQGGEGSSQPPVNLDLKK